MFQGRADPSWEPLRVLSTLQFLLPPRTAFYSRKFRAPLVPSAGFEPATHGLGNRCSILLSYEGMRSHFRTDLIIRGAGIRDHYFYEMEARVADERFRFGQPGGWTSTAWRIRRTRP